MTAIYGASFYGYGAALARQSAAVICPIIFEDLQPKSVLDVGCGQGAWLTEWRALGVTAHGVDFAAATSSGNFAIPDGCFVVRDLTQGLGLEGRFDLVQCLEVAEHLPARIAPALIAELAARADVVLFSAAPLGQGGEHHVNEQPFEYWRDLWAEQGFSLYDGVRGRILGDRRVAPWYRYNMFIFANAVGALHLPDWLRGQQIAGNQSIPDVAPLPYRLRRFVIRCFPVGVVTALARLHSVIDRFLQKANDDD